MTKVLLADVNNHVPVPVLPRKVMVRSAARWAWGRDGRGGVTVVVAGRDGAAARPDPVASQLQLGSAFNFFALRKALD